MLQRTHSRTSADQTTWFRVSSVCLCLSCNRPVCYVNVLVEYCHGTRPRQIILLECALVFFFCGHFSYHVKGTITDACIEIIHCGCIIANDGNPCLGWWKNQDGCMLLFWTSVYRNFYSSIVMLLFLWRHIIRFYIVYLRIIRSGNVAAIVSKMMILPPFCYVTFDLIEFDFYAPMNNLVCLWNGVIYLN